MTDHLLPATDLAEYLRRYVREMAFGDDDPADVVDRYHTPDITWVSDGHPLDRAALAAHARPSRRNVTACQVEVHDALVDGDRAAARYTLTATLRTGRAVVTEIYLFGALAPDGRLRRVEQLTRTAA